MSLKPTVFVSSTVKDLHNERLAARRAIERIPANPRFSEYDFEAQNRPSKDVCVREVKKGDIFVLVLGGRYGFTFDDGKSVTELEWETARDEKKPILVFDTTYSKEPKQEEFARRVGDFNKGRNFKKVRDAFELETEVEKSIRLFMEETKFELSRKTEGMFANLLEVQFPDVFYEGNIAYDRQDVIKISENRLRWKAAERQVAWEALKQKGVKFGADWVISNSRIASFHDLRDSNVPLSHIIDTGTIESFSPDEYCDLSPEHENNFRALLRQCLQQKLFKMKIEWNHDEKLFVFQPVDSTFADRKATWYSGKGATRTVFQARRSKKDPNKIFDYRHLAFEVRFERLNSIWYVSLTPTWFISYLTPDGLKKSRYGYQSISYLKRVEHNEAVFNHVKFLVYKLKYGDSTDMFRESYQFLSFGKLQQFEAYPVLPDTEWVRSEGLEAKSNMTDEEGTIVF